MTDLQRAKWNRRFIDLAYHVAEWSRDPSTKVGAVITDGAKRVIGMGFNGFPAGVEDTDARYEERSVKYKLIVHAEANAIMHSGVRVNGGWLFTTMFPCTDCTKLIIQSGIIAVVTPKPRDDLWGIDAEFSSQMLFEAAIKVEYIDARC